MVWVLVGDGVMGVASAIDLLYVALAVCPWARDIR